MKEYRIFYLIKNGETIPVDYTDVVDEKDEENYADAAFFSYINNRLKDVPEEEKEEKYNEFVEDLESGITDKGFEIVLPKWCEKPVGNYDQVAYLVVDRRKKDEEAFIGLYANEYDAWFKTHEIISGEDLECFEPAPVYYLRLFKLTVKNVMPVGDDVYAKYNYETMQFDI